VEGLGEGTDTGWIHALGPQLDQIRAAVTKLSGEVDGIPSIQIRRINERVQPAIGQWLHSQMQQREQPTERQRLVVVRSRSQSVSILLVVPGTPAWTEWKSPLNDGLMNLGSCQR